MDIFALFSAAARFFPGRRDSIPEKREEKGDETFFFSQVREKKELFLSGLFFFGVPNCVGFFRQTFLGVEKKERENLFLFEQEE